MDLDLSRNGLTTLEGLQSLRRLRRLNLYYNMIGRLSELDRLRSHPELAVFDVRLNPLTHTGTRHRLRLGLAQSSGWGCLPLRILRPLPLRDALRHVGGAHRP